MLFRPTCEPTACSVMVVYISSMKSITLQLPDSLGLDDKDVLHLFAASLYEKGKLTLGQAAEMTGISKREFVEGLGKCDVSVFNFPIADLANDVKNA